MNQNYVEFESVKKAGVRSVLPTAAALRRLSMLVMMLFSVQTFAQDRVITGTVKEASGSTLPGVNVVVKGTTQGTQTDVDGNFRLANVPAKATLIFSFIGKLSQEVAVGNQTALNIVLQDDAKSLQEVVVVGYGTQRRQDLTGSIASVSARDFQQGNIVNPEQLVAGKIAGVSITPPSGQPGGGSQIRIRGGSSLNANNDPLIVIDGVPVDNSVSTERGGLSGSANALSFVNPNDIETFTVLKDASATAIYGSRASNGVIIITTKKGRTGDKLRVGFSSLTSLSQPTRFVDVLSGDQYRELLGQVGSASQRALLGKENTDWQRQIFESAISTDNNLSLTGSFYNIPYRASVGYLNQDGILKTSNFQRLSSSLGLSPRFLDNNLKVDVNIKTTGVRNRFANQAAIGAAVSFDPTQPVFSGRENFGGFFEWVNANGNPEPLAPRNPLGLLLQREDLSNVFRGIGNIVLDYKMPFLPALRANLNLGMDLSSSRGTIFVPATAASDFVNRGTNNQYEQRRRNSTAEFYLNYASDLRFLNSRIDATAGYAYQDFLTINPAFPNRRADESVITPAGLEFRPQNRLKSYFGRVNYSILGRYILTFTGRYDGSSRFAPENRWGFFPSGAFAWNIKEESFLKGVKAISALKLRLGAGVTGQQDVFGNFPFLARYSLSDPTAQYQFGNEFVRTLRPEGYDRNIKWEETITYNAGLDYAFLNGRISGAIDVYNRQTNDLLATIPVPAGSNLTNQILTNVGSLRNRGIEFTINTTPVETEKLTWEIGFNATYNENKITSLAKIPSQEGAGVLVGGISGGVGNTIQINTVGYPANTFFVQRQVYNEQGQPIEGLYEDRDGSGTITPDDRYRSTQPAPLVFLGLSSNLTYNKFSFGFTMRGNLGNYVYNNVYSNLGAYTVFTGASGYLANVSGNVLDTRFRSNQYFSDYYLQNASFLRMDNINLGYNVGRIFNEWASLRLSANVQNAFVITKYTGIDPEIAGGIDNNFYPRPRIFALGLNLDF